MGQPKREKITKTVVDATEKDAARNVFVWDTQLKGFGLQRVRPSGRKVYEVRYPRGSRRRLYTIGDNAVRCRPKKRGAGRCRSQSVVDGLEAQDERALNRRALTVAELIAAYLETGPGDKPEKRASSWATDTYNLKRHAEPLIGRIVARDLTAADLSEWQAAVAAGKTATKAKSEKKRGRINVNGGPGAAARATRTVAAMLSRGNARASSAPVPPCGSTSSRMFAGNAT